MPQVSVGCKLPNGLILEMGYKLGLGGSERGVDYKRVELRGANQHHVQDGPAPAHFEPGITHGVDEEFYDAWVKSHADSNIVKNKLIFKSKTHAEAKAQALDVTQRPTGMEPLNANAVAKSGVTKATFGDDSAPPTR